MCVATAALLALLVVPPIGSAQDVAAPCEDTHEERAGVLKWAVRAVVFSASTAIATRDVDHERVNGVCTEVAARCVALAADGSRLEVVEHPGGSAYSARFKGVVGLSEGTGQCDSVRRFEGTDGVVRILFEG